MLQDAILKRKSLRHRRTILSAPVAAFSGRSIRGVAISTPRFVIDDNSQESLAVEGKIRGKVAGKIRTVRSIDQGRHNERIPPDA
jgi:hypothetical protein